MQAGHASALARHALNSLDAGEPCCGRCCAPCHALLELKASGQLEVILAKDGPGHDWWDEETGQVCPRWLDVRIQPYCESGHMLDPGRCTDLYRDGDPGEVMLCAMHAPWRCPDQHEACRPQRICDLDGEHQGPHSWEHGELSCLLAVEAG